MSENQKIQISKQNSKIVVLALIILAIGYFGFYQPAQKTEPSQIAEASFDDRKAEKEAELEKVQAEKAKLELEAKKIELEKQVLEVEESLKVSGLAQTISTKAEELAPKVEPVKEAPKEQPKPVANDTSIATRKFRLNNGKFIEGQKLLDIVKGNPAGLKLWKAFNDRFGQVVADTAAISLYYENGTMKTNSIGVCSRKFMVGGDYRNCNFADLNSAGMDAGLKQINTFYQRKRIAKLGGPDCNPSNSRDRKDPCTAKQIEWLVGVDNNIKIALDIYSEQGFKPWYGWRRAFNK